ncbi:MAG: hypothetical protein V4630_03200, partial [Pseudomonadota bacterium]
PPAGWLFPIPAPPLDLEKVVIKFTAATKIKPYTSAPLRMTRRERTHPNEPFYRKLKLSRIMLRDLASFGQIPGMVKSSW